MKNPVILVHGIFDTSRRMSTISAFLKSCGFEVYSVSLRPSSGKLGLDQLAYQIKDFVELNLTQEERFNLVAFSMGGLVCRYFLQRLGGYLRMNRFITISSPHHGTIWGFLYPVKGARQMRIGSDFLIDLNRDFEQLIGERITSIWTPFDLMILPSSSSRVSFGREVKFNVLLHPWMMRDKQVINYIKEELS